MGREDAVSKGKIIGGAVALVVIGAIVGGVWYSSAANAPAVSTATVSRETLGVVVTASGKIEAARKAEVYAPTTGTLKSVEVTDGAVVKAGETLAVMDKAQLEMQVRQAVAGLKGAQAQLDAVNRGVPAAIDKAAAEAGVNAARAGYDAASKAYASVREAYDAAPPAVRASLEATLTQLDAARKQAYAGLLNARSGQAKISSAGSSTAAARESARAAVDSASFALKTARDLVDKAEITAPISGVVVFNAIGAPGADGSAPKAAKGAAVTPAAAAFTVVDLSKLDFNAQVDEADIARVRAGLSAKVSLDAFGDMVFNGTVGTVRTTAIQTTTGGIAFPVLISIDATTGQNLMIGMSGSTDIEVEAVPGALTVPIEAVLDDAGKKWVFLVKDDKVEKVEVTTGALTDTQAEIVSGVSEGDTVVTSKLTELKDGMAVRPE